MKNLKYMYVLIVFVVVMVIYGLGNRNYDEDISALGKATNYSRMMYLSKEDLFDELNDEFTEDEIQDAMDKVVTSYKVNALRKAYDYYRMDVSEYGIYDSLMNEGFTVEEVNYAIEHLDEFDN